MKTKLIYFLITFIFLISISTCFSQKYSSTNLPDKQLVFGSGGGASGQVKKYILLENGQLFSYNSLKKKTKEIKKANKEEAAKIFADLKALDLEKMNFNHPGNMTYFIRKKEGVDETEVRWGSPDHQEPAEIKEFYKRLTALVKSK